MTRSLARPKLLFVCKKGDELVFFSSPQHQNPDDDEKSSPAVANYPMKFTVDDLCDITCPVNGLICVRHWLFFKDRTETVLVICNPSTGQSLPLPKSKKGSSWESNFLGYDPIDKKFKVLASTYVKKQ